MSATQIRGNTQIKAGTITDAEISASAAIALSKLAEAVIQADGGQAFTADQSLGGFKITNLGTPSSSTDAATKGYVDAVGTGLDVKASVRGITTGALSAYTYANGSSGVGATITKNSAGSINSESVDGLTLIVGDRLLVKDETAGSAKYNGIYTVTTVGSGGVAFVLTRATDADTAAEVTAGMYTFVEEGTLYADTGWVLTTDNPITIGTTGLTFTQFTGIGALVAGGGLTLTGTTLAVGAGDGITVNADDVAVNVSAIAGTNLENDGSNNLRIAAAAAGAGLTGGGASALAVGAGDGITVNANDVAAKVSDFAGTNLEDDGSNNLRIAASAAGGGLQGGGAAVLSIDWVNSETPSGTVNGSNDTFTLANTPVAGTVMVFKNGILQEAGSGNDYTISTVTIVFESGTIPVSGDKIRACYFK